eukprot:1569766-Rhodomonas_salina.5
MRPRTWSTCVATKSTDAPGTACWMASIQSLTVRVKWSASHSGSTPGHKASNATQRRAVRSAQNVFSRILGRVFNAPSMHSRAAQTST